MSVDPSDPHATHRLATAVFSAALIGGLRDAGVRQLVASPGSRSTPLVLAAHATDGLELAMHHDERSAAFFALGIAKTTGEPVALLCTSGSAAANYLPAVVEAHYACVPLVLLTADRPPELREWGAGQTIDQTRLFGSHTRAFVETPVPSDDVDVARLGRIATREAARAVAGALGRPAGPVHLNCPFREPLEPPLGDASQAAVRIVENEMERRVAAPRVRRPAPGDADVDALVRSVLRNAHGVIACGGLSQDGTEPEWPEALLRFAVASGWPVIADPLSQLRCGAQVAAESAAGPVIACASDLVLRDERVRAALRPDAVLRIGASPTSKAFRLWLEAAPPREWLAVDPDGQWNDPSRLATDTWIAEPGPLLARAADRLASSQLSDREARDAWRQRFATVERAAGSALDAASGASAPLLEPEVTRLLGAALPADALLFVASSMAIRDVDAFLSPRARPLRMLANRGANGIDGMVSTALGCARAGRGPVVALLGDLAFLHDLGGLAVARRLGIDATIIVMNNDGGGIFSFLPIAERSARSGESETFEALFHTAHGIDLAGSAALFGIDFERVASREALEKALARSLASPGVGVIEVPIDRDANLEHFRALARGAGDAAASALGLGGGAS